MTTLETPETFREYLSDIYYLFQEAVVTTLNGYDHEERVKIKEFIIHLCRETPVYSFLTHEGLPKLQDHIFTVEYHRDFLWKLLFHFFSLSGYTLPEYKKLCQVLAFSLDVADTGQPLSLSPRVLQDRLMSDSDIGNTLLTNKWLTAIILLSLLYHRQFTGSKQSLKDIIESGL